MSAGRRESPTFLTREVASWASVASGVAQRVRWEDLPKGINGRPLHLLGLIVTMAIQYDAVAASMPSAFPGRRLFDLISRCTLRVGTHTFIDGVRGGALYWDAFRMMGNCNVFDVPSDVADGDATNATATIRLYIPIARQRGAGSEFDGSIPLAALRNEDLEMAFTSSGAFQEFAFAGLTLDSVSVTVEAHMVALAQLRVPTGWRLTAEGPFTELERAFPTNGFIYYAHVGDESIATTPDASGYGETTLTVGAGQADPVSVVAQVRRFNAESRVQNPGASNLGSAPEFLPLIRSAYNDLATRQPIGRVKVKFASRQYASTRIQWRERGTRTNELRATFYRRLGIDPRTLVGPHAPKLRTAKKSRDVDAWLRPHFDESVSPPGTEFSAVAETPGA